MRARLAYLALRGLKAQVMQSLRADWVLHLTGAPSEIHCHEMPTT